MDTRWGDAGVETSGTAGGRWIGSILTAAGAPGVGKKASAQGSESTRGVAMSPVRGGSAFQAPPSSSSAPTAPGTAR